MSSASNSIKLRSDFESEIDLERAPSSSDCNKERRNSADESKISLDKDNAAFRFGKSTQK